MRDFSKVFIGNEWVEPRSKKKMEIRNPATGDAISKVPLCGAEDVDAAVKAARRAQRDWWRKPGIEKAVLLREVGQRIRARIKELAELMTLETGKPLCESHDCIDWVAACFEYYSEFGRASRGNSAPPVAPHQVNFTIKEPYGVVAAIVPFNFPLLLMSWKVAPALAAGNTVVCKAPHQNPLTNLLLAEVYSILPPGVVNVITGDGPETGEALIRHPEVDLIAFTGSTETGKHIAKTAAEQLKKINLELGGIDPFIVFEDADLNVAVPGVAWARLLNAGQVCTSSKRIYVVEKILPKFIDMLVSHVKTVKVGDPMNSSTDVGPLITEAALQKVDAQVKKLVAEGAKLMLGGRRVAGKGFFYEPTILTGVRHGGVATTEEIFGPVISVIAAKDADDAIRMANDSKYGLGCCIYTNNLQWSMKAMDEIKAGTFWINDPLTDNDAAPFGGMRWSGVGRELGEEGLDAFREPKHVHMDYVMEKKNFWFPYKDRSHG